MKRGQSKASRTAARASKAAMRTGWRDRVANQGMWTFWVSRDRVAKK